MDSNQKKRKVGRINCGFLDYNLMKISLKRKQPVAIDYLNVNLDFHLAKVSDYSRDDDDIFKGGLGRAAVLKAQAIQRTEIFDNPSIGQKKNAKDIYAKSIPGHPTAIDIKNIEENQEVLISLYGEYETELERKIMFEKDIVTIFNTMRFQIGGKGFLYIKDTVLYCFMHGLKTCKISAVQDLVSKAYGVSLKTVEKSIRALLVLANYNGGLDNIKNHLGMPADFKHQPTNTEFIFGCVSILPYLLIQLNKEKKERAAFKIFPKQ